MAITAQSMTPPPVRKGPLEVCALSQPLRLPSFIIFATLRIHLGGPPAGPPQDPIL
jgi:hypothetical protein